jgi:restriction endonuclease S subunit
VARVNINLEEIGTIRIVLPPIDKQNEIASHILEVRQKAKALQEEGKAILEEAKRKIETMIINVN